MKKIKTWIHNLSLEKKIFVSFSLVGFLVLSSIFLIAMLATYRMSMENYKNIVTINYDQTVENLTNQMEKMNTISGIISTNQYINTRLNRIYREKDYASQYIKFQEIQSYLDTMDYSAEFSNMLFFLKNDYLAFQSALPSIQDLNSARGKELAKKTARNGSKPVWMSGSRNGEEETYLSITRIIPNLLNYEEEFGILTLNLALEEVKGNMVTSIDRQVIYIRDKDGTLITANDREKLDQIGISEAQEQSLGTRLSEKTIHGRRYLGMRTATDFDGVEILTLVPEYRLFESARSNVMPLILFYLAICVFMFVIVLLITKSITRRILLLSDTMLGVKEGKLNTLDVEEYHDEIGTLISNYNYMVGQIELLLERQFELGEEKRVEELKALQSQINPHFLYNTLDMINWMAQKGERENVSRIVQALARYYKLTLNHAEDIVTIGEEIELCKSYIAIQQIRFKGKIKFVVDVDEAIWDYKIPKITLQPLIENAIVHGLAESTDGRGTITVGGWDEEDEDGTITLTVTDNGVGIDAEKLSGDDGAEPDKGNHYGIKNIEKRLCLFYNLESCLKLESVPMMGSCVSLTIKKKR